MRRYHLHPIKDRARIQRWLPKLYVGYCRRHGHPHAYRFLGGWVPAMRVTETGAPPGVTPYTGADFWAVVERCQGTNRQYPTDSPAIKRARKKVKDRSRLPFLER